MDVSDDTKVSLPLRNIISIVAGVAVATWAYSGLVQRLNTLELQQAVDEAEIELNSDFRIGWPRGQFGGLPDDSKQNMEIERLLSLVADMKDKIDRLEEWQLGFEPPQEVQDAIAQMTELQIRLGILEAELERLQAE
jgi:hypothetical protein